MTTRIIALSLLTWLTAACVHIPEKLSVADDASLTNFEQAKSQENALKGSVARWGGVIAKVNNEADRTVIEVVHFDLKGSTRPKVKDETKGRFKVIYSGLLDPVIYKEGRSITAIGRIGDLTEGKIGEHSYQYPTLVADYVHLWKEVKQVDIRVEHYPHWYTPSLWHYANPYYHRPIYRRVNSPTKTNATKTNNK
ncbi:Slp family lipoprotein [Thalassotalea sp. 1_MG-2023]|uniref:Slp family lipoprotein n=1 Tax=Thalassotalea sp. 1_MG-2023 TaxID=3062680 RepID=UPI0026E4274F|nr:Slp family lipoprotein [Thalassotalea sp. 1_MG-2023]MDO6427855.1 Slp family lipoprotein [Thalassotalea sp. 1_MG-2023]